MSDLLFDVLNVLAQRSTAASRRQIEAKGIYARFMLNPKSGEDSADAVVAAADELGIRTDGVVRDLVYMAFTKAFASQIKENDNAIEQARAAILAAKRKVTAARGQMSTTAIDRANADLRERVSDAVTLEEWGENLRKALDFFKERCESLEADIDAAAAAKREAVEREKQFAASNKAPRAPADSNTEVADADSAGDAPTKTIADVIVTEAARSVVPAGNAIHHDMAPGESPLGAPIIPDLTPKPIAD